MSRNSTSQGPTLNLVTETRGIDSTWTHMLQMREEDSSSSISWSVSIDGSKSGHFSRLNFPAVFILFAAWTNPTITCSSSICFTGTRGKKNKETCWHLAETWTLTRLQLSPINNLLPTNTIMSIPLPQLNNIVTVQDECWHTDNQHSHRPAHWVPHATE